LNVPLLERLTIALLAVVLLAVLVGAIKYDMELTAASRPEPQRVSRRADETPSVAIANLLGCIAPFQLAQRMADRGEGYCDTFILQRVANLRRSQRVRRRCL
jgi:hypothetical protein